MLEQAHQPALDRSVVFPDLTGLLGRDAVGPLSPVVEAEVRLTLRVGIPAGFVGHGGSLGQCSWGCWATLPDRRPPRRSSRSGRDPPAPRFGDDVTAQFDTLTIFYPMWNEAETIRRAVAAGIEAGDRLVADGEIDRFDILIIDDASTDDTGVIADKLAAEDPRVRVVHHPVNRKLGGSLKTGLRRGHRRPHPLHRRRPAVRHGRAVQGGAAAAHLRRRHRQRLPVRPHRRGASPARLQLRLQPPDPDCCSGCACGT